MSSDSIEAYDLPERVRRYDADMDIMHPLRHEMIEIAIDGSSSMLELAEVRLREFSHRVELVTSDFRAIPATVLAPGAFDVVISSYALHHLDAHEKLAVLRSVVPAMRPGGWFLNADLVVADSPDIEKRVQEIRVEAVTRRAPENDRRFRSAAATRQYLEELEETEQDQPQTLTEDIRVVREAGIKNAEVLWKELREVVIGGYVPIAVTHA